MILDNARIHHAKLLHDFLKQNERLTLMFLPPYSPNLNMMEGLWAWLKESVVNNTFLGKLAQIKLAVRSFISWIALNCDLVIQRLCLQF